MAFSIPRLIALANGVYHLNIRVPSDLADKAKGTVVTLPIDEVRATVRVGDKVIVSLRTKDPSVAKARFAEAEQALARHWTAIRSGPVTLPHKQCVALAGDVYRRWVETYESDPDMTPERFAADMRLMDAEVEAWRYDPSDGAGQFQHRCRQHAQIGSPQSPPPSKACLGNAWFRSILRGRSRRVGPFRGAVVYACVPLGFGV